MTDIHNLILQTAIELAKKAGEVQLQYFRNPNLKSDTKLNSFDVVTEADKASEAIILGGIKAAFPTHSILSEESGDNGDENAEWRWIVDPLDGTTNFNAGLPIFTVSIAVQHRGKTVVGVVYAPYLRELFTATEGMGALLNGRPISVRRNSVLDTMVVATGMPYDRATNPDNNLDNIANVCLKVRGTRRLASAALDLCYTAAGFFDVYWELNLSHWDCAAGMLIVHEAGGETAYIRTNRNHSVIAGSKEALSTFRPLIK